MDIEKMNIKHTGKCRKKSLLIICKGVVNFNFIVTGGGWDWNTQLVSYWGTKIPN